MFPASKKKPSRFPDEHAELVSLLTAEEYKAAKLNSVNAHYTDTAIARVMWEALGQFGFAGGRVVEPGCGSGNFIGLAPLGTAIVGVELDPVTAQIAAALYPHAQIRAENFRDTRFPAGSFDAAIGNVPFGKIHLDDPVFNPGGRDPIHTHFVRKSAGLVRPGGLLALITSRYTMDGKEEDAVAARRELSGLGELLAAVRLPETAHRRTAGTKVVTDVLFLRRFEEGEQAPDGDPAWIETVPVQAGDAEIRVNRYFAEHPDMVLGELAGGGAHGPDDLRVVAPADADTATALADAVGRAAEARKAATVPRPVATPSGGRAPVEGFQEARPDGTFTRITDGVPVEFTPPGGPAGHAELRALLGIRDTVLALLDAELATADDAGLVDDLRARLNSRYDNYVKTYGPAGRYNPQIRIESNAEGRELRGRLLAEGHASYSGGTADITDRAVQDRLIKAGHATRSETGEFKFRRTRAARAERERLISSGQAVRRGGTFQLTDEGRAWVLDHAADLKDAVTVIKKRPPQGGFRTDPYCHRVLSLEKYDPETGTASKQDIMRHRLLLPRPVIDRADSPADALAVCLDRHAEVRLDVIASLLGAASEDEARDQLGALVYHDPAEDRLIPGPEYLSGNVRKKLRQAQAAAASDLRYQANVDALKDVVPRDLGPADIEARPGAVFITAEEVQQFLREILDDTSVTVSRGSDGKWDVRGADHTNAATIIWGTKDKNALALAENLLNRGKPVEVTRTGPNKVKYVDEEATAAARDKQAELSDRFAGWAWEDLDRTEAICSRYNELFRSVVLRSYDEVSLSLPGVNRDIDLYWWQKTAIARMIYEPSAGLYHDMGAGKTLEMIIGLMEQRRLGLIKKPVIVVKNSLLEQFRDEFMWAYPQARLLCADTGDLSGDGRRAFLARCASESPDAIIMTRGAYESIPLTYEGHEAYLAHIQEIFEAHAESVTDSVKEQATMIAEFEEQLRAYFDPAVQDEDEQGEEGEDGGAKTGKRKRAPEQDPTMCFEHLDVDYLGDDEAQDHNNLWTPSEEPGLGIPFVYRAIDHEAKLFSVRRRFGNRAGAETTGTPVTNKITQFHVLMRRMRPERLKELGFDDFAAWAATFTEPEQRLEMMADGKFRMVTRMRLINFPELLQELHYFGDFKDADAIGLERPAIRGGKPEIKAVPATQALKDYQATLPKRYLKAKSGKKRKGDDTVVAVIGDGFRAAQDLRLVKANHGVQPGFTDEPQKIHYVADDVYAEWEAHRDREYLDDQGQPSPVKGGLQLVFCNEGVPTKRGEWNLYEELRDLLVAKGMPRDMIRFIHEAADSRQKKELFAACRAGHVAVLIGSTEKMGVGVNVQNRCIGVHHVHPHWRPDYDEQEDARARRPKNQNAEVFIKKWITEGSFDTIRAQACERKSIFLRVVKHPDPTVRSIEAPGDDTVAYAQIAAVAAGDPRLAQKAELGSKLHQLVRKQRRHSNSQHALTVARQQSLAAIGHAETAIARIDAAAGKVVSTSGDNFAMTVAGTRFEARRDAGDRLKEHLRDTLKTVPVGSSRSVDVGMVGGLRITAELHGYPCLDDIVIRLDDVPGTEVSMHHGTLPSALGLVAQLEHRLTLLDGLRRENAALIEEEKGEVRRADSAIGAEFPQQAELLETKKAYDALVDALRDDKKEPAAGGGKPADDSAAAGTGARHGARHSPARRSGAGPAQPGSGPAADAPDGGAAPGTGRPGNGDAAVPGLGQLRPHVAFASAREEFAERVAVLRDVALVSTDLADLARSNSEARFLDGFSAWADEHVARLSDDETSQQFVTAYLGDEQWRHDMLAAVAAEVHSAALSGGGAQAGPGSSATLPAWTGTSPYAAAIAAMHRAALADDGLRHEALNSSRNAFLPLVPRWIRDYQSGPVPPLPVQDDPVLAADLASSVGTAVYAACTGEAPPHPDDPIPADVTRAAVDHWRDASIAVRHAEGDAGRDIEIAAQIDIWLSRAGLSRQGRRVRLSGGHAVVEVTAADGETWTLHVPRRNARFESESRYNLTRSTPDYWHLLMPCDRETSSPQQAAETLTRCFEAENVTLPASPASPPSPQAAAEQAGAWVSAHPHADAITQLIGRAERDHDVIAWASANDPGRFFLPFSRWIADAVADLMPEDGPLPPFAEDFLSSSPLFGAAVTEEAARHVYQRHGRHWIPPDAFTYHGGQQAARDAEGGGGRATAACGCWSGDVPDGAGADSVGAFVIGMHLARAGVPVSRFGVTWEDSSGSWAVCLHADDGSVHRKLISPGMVMADAPGSAETARALLDAAGFAAPPAPPGKTPGSTAPQPSDPASAPADQSSGERPAGPAPGTSTSGSVPAVPDAPEPGHGTPEAGTAAARSRSAPADAGTGSAGAADPPEPVRTDRKVRAEYRAAWFRRLAAERGLLAEGGSIVAAPGAPVMLWQFDPGGALLNGPGRVIPDEAAGDYLTACTDDPEATPDAVYFQVVPGAAAGETSSPRESAHGVASEAALEAAEAGSSRYLYPDGRAAVASPAPPPSGAAYYEVTPDRQWTLHMHGASEQVRPVKPQDLDFIAGEPAGPAAGQEPGTRTDGPDAEPYTTAEDWIAGVTAAESARSRWGRTETGAWIMSLTSQEVKGNRLYGVRAAQQDASDGVYMMRAFIGEPGDSLGLALRTAQGAEDGCRTLEEVLRAEDYLAEEDPAALREWLAAVRVHHARVQATLDAGLASVLVPSLAAHAREPGQPDGPQADEEADGDPPGREEPAEITPTGIVIEHGHGGTVIRGTDREDTDVHRVIKNARGFKWSKRQEMWYLPRRMTFDTRDWKVTRLRQGLEELGRPFRVVENSQAEEAGQPVPAPTAAGDPYSSAAQARAACQAVWSRYWKMQDSSAGQRMFRYSQSARPDATEMKAAAERIHALLWPEQSIDTVPVAQMLAEAAHAGQVLQANLAAERHRAPVFARNLTELITAASEAAGRMAATAAAGQDTLALEEEPVSGPGTEDETPASAADGENEELSLFGTSFTGADAGSRPEPASSVSAQAGMTGTDPLTAGTGEPGDGRGSRGTQGEGEAGPAPTGSQPPADARDDEGDGAALSPAPSHAEPSRPAATAEDSGRVAIDRDGPLHPQGPASLDPARDAGSDGPTAGVVVLSPDRDGRQPVTRNGEAAGYLRWRDQTLAQFDADGRQTGTLYRSDGTRTADGTVTYTWRADLAAARFADRTEVARRATLEDAVAAVLDATAARDAATPTADPGPPVFVTISDPAPAPDDAGQPGPPPHAEPVEAHAAWGGPLRPERLLYTDGTPVTVYGQGDDENLSWAGTASGTVPAPDDSDHAPGRLQVVRWESGRYSVFPPALVFPAGADRYPGLDDRARQRCHFVDLAEASGTPIGGMPPGLVDPGDTIEVTVHKGRGITFKTVTRVALSDNGVYEITAVTDGLAPEGEREVPGVGPGTGPGRSTVAYPAWSRVPFCVPDRHPALDSAIASVLDGVAGPVQSGPESPRGAEEPRPGTADGSQDPARPEAGSGLNRNQRQPAPSPDLRMPWRVRGLLSGDGNPPVPQVTVLTRAVDRASAYRIPQRTSDGRTGEELIWVSGPIRGNGTNAGKYRLMHQSVVHGPSETEKGRPREASNASDVVILYTYRTSRGGAETEEIDSYTLDAFRPSPVEDAVIRASGAYDQLLPWQKKNYDDQVQAVARFSFHRAQAREWNAVVPWLAARAGDGGPLPSMDETRDGAGLERLDVEVYQAACRVARHYAAAGIDPPPAYASPGGTPPDDVSPEQDGVGRGMPGGADVPSAAQAAAESGRTCYLYRAPVPGSPVRRAVSDVPPPLAAGYLSVDPDGTWKEHGQGQEHLIGTADGDPDPDYPLTLTEARELAAAAGLEAVIRRVAERAFILLSEPGAADAPALCWEYGSREVFAGQEVMTVSQAIGWLGEYRQAVDRLAAEAMAPVFTVGREVEEWARRVAHLAPHLVPGPRSRPQVREPLLAAVRAADIGTYPSAEHLLREAETEAGPLVLSPAREAEFTRRIADNAARWYQLAQAPDVARYIANRGAVNPDARATWREEGWIRDRIAAHPEVLTVPVPAGQEDAAAARAEQDREAAAALMTEAKAAYDSGRYAEALERVDDAEIRAFPGAVPRADLVSVRTTEDLVAIRSRISEAAAGPATAVRPGGESGAHAGSEETGTGAEPLPTAAAAAAAAAAADAPLSDLAGAHDPDKPGSSEQDAEDEPAPAGSDGQPAPADEAVRWDLVTGIPGRRFLFGILGGHRMRVERTGPGRTAAYRVSVGRDVVGEHEDESGARALAEAHARALPPAPPPAWPAPDDGAGLSVQEMTAAYRAAYRQAPSGQMRERWQAGHVDAGTESASWYRAARAVKRDDRADWDMGAVPAYMAAADLEAAADTLDVSTAQVTRGHGPDPDDARYVADALTDAALMLREGDAAEAQEAISSGQARISPASPLHEVLARHAPLVAAFASPPEQVQGNLLEPDDSPVAGSAPAVPAEPNSPGPGRDPGPVTLVYAAQLDDLVAAALARPSLTETARRGDWQNYQIAFASWGRQHLASMASAAVRDAGDAGRTVPKWARVFLDGDALAADLVAVAAARVMQQVAAAGRADATSPGSPPQSRSRPHVTADGRAAVFTGIGPDGDEGPDALMAQALLGGYADAEDLAAGRNAVREAVWKVPAESEDARLLRTFAGAAFSDASVPGAVIQYGLAHGKAAELTARLVSPDGQGEYAEFQAALRAERALGRHLARLSATPRLPALLGDAAGMPADDPRPDPGRLGIGLRPYDGHGDCCAAQEDVRALATAYLETNGGTGLPPLPASVTGLHYAGLRGWFGDVLSSWETAAFDLALLLPSAAPGDAGQPLRDLAHAVCLHAARLAAHRDEAQRDALPYVTAGYYTAGQESATAALAAWKKTSTARWLSGDQFPGEARDREHHHRAQGSFRAVQRAFHDMTNPMEPWYGPDLETEERHAARAAEACSLLHLTIDAGTWQDPADRQVLDNLVYTAGVHAARITASRAAGTAQAVMAGLAEQDETAGRVAFMSGLAARHGMTANYRDFQDDVVIYAPDEDGPFEVMCQDRPGGPLLGATGRVIPGDRADAYLAAAASGTGDPDALYAMTIAGDPARAGKSFSIRDHIRAYRTARDDASGTAPRHVSGDGRALVITWDKPPAGPHFTVDPDGTWTGSPGTFPLGKAKGPAPVHFTALLTEPGPELPWDQPPDDSPDVPDPGGAGIIIEHGDPRTRVLGPGTSNGPVAALLRRNKFKQASSGVWYLPDSWGPAARSRHVAELKSGLDRDGCEFAQRPSRPAARTGFRPDPDAAPYPDLRDVTFGYLKALKAYDQVNHNAPALWRHGGRDDTRAVRLAAAALRTFNLDGPGPGATGDLDATLRVLSGLLGGLAQATAVLQENLKSRPAPKWKPRLEALAAAASEAASRTAATAAAGMIAAVPEPEPVRDDTPQAAESPGAADEDQPADMTDLIHALQGMGNLKIAHIGGPATEDAAAETQPGDKPSPVSVSEDGPASGKEKSRKKPVSKPFLNEDSIDHAVELWHDRTPLGAAVLTVASMKEFTFATGSDGWAYWQLAHQAAGDLAVLIDYDQRSAWRPQPGDLRVIFDNSAKTYADPTWQELKSAFRGPRTLRTKSRKQGLRTDFVLYGPDGPETCEKGPLAGTDLAEALRGLSLADLAGLAAGRAPVIPWQRHDSAPGSDRAAGFHVAVEYTSAYGITVTVTGGEQRGGLVTWDQASQWLGSALPPPVERLLAEASRAGLERAATGNYRQDRERAALAASVKDHVIGAALAVHGAGPLLQSALDKPADLFSLPPEPPVSPADDEASTALLERVRALADGPGQTENKAGAPEDHARETAGPGPEDDSADDAVPPKQTADPAKTKGRAGGAACTERLTAQEMTAAYEAECGREPPAAIVREWEAGQISTATRNAPWYPAAIEAKNDGRPMSAVPFYVTAGVMDATADQITSPGYRAPGAQPRADHVRVAADALREAAAALRGLDPARAREVVGGARTQIRYDSPLQGDLYQFVVLLNGLGTPPQTLPDEPAEAQAIPSAKQTESSDAQTDEGKNGPAPAAAHHETGSPENPGDRDLARPAETPDESGTDGISQARSTGSAWPGGELAMTPARHHDPAAALADLPPRFAAALIVGTARTEVSELRDAARWAQEGLSAEMSAFLREAVSLGDMTSEAASRFADRPSGKNFARYADAIDRVIVPGIRHVTSKAAGRHAARRPVRATAFRPGRPIRL